MTGRLVAISQRVVEHDAYPERRDALSQEWAAWMAANLPDDEWIAIPNAHPDLAGWCHRFDPDVLILSGGSDIGANPDRDVAETTVSDWFRTERRPIIGVCRGAQLLNVGNGGTLRVGPGHVATPHTVRLTGQLAALSDVDLLDVNSFHANVIDESGLGSDLVATGFADDGTVEAFAHTTELIMGIQWHPERVHGSAHATAAILRTFIDQHAPIDHD